MSETVGYVVLGLIWLGILLHLIFVFWQPRRIFKDRQLLFVTVVIFLHLLISVPPSLMGTPFINTRTPWFWSLEYPGAFFLSKVAYGTSEDHLMDTPLITPLNMAILTTFFFGLAAFLISQVVKVFFRALKRSTYSK
ncbi:hypothetical protein ACFLU6_08860 [Acidobacteriota bacterium]